MGYRTLELNVASGKHLKDVNFLSKMDVYVVVSISGGDQWTMKKQKTKTHVDRSGGSNPTWNFPIKFTVDESLAHQNRLTLVFEIKSDGILGDKKIGEVIVPIKELLDSPGDGNSMKFVSYQVRTPSGKPKGELHFSYKFTAAGTVTGPTVKADEPVMAYPAQGVGSSSAPYGAAGKPYPPPTASAPYDAAKPYPPPTTSAPYDAAAKPYPPSTASASYDAAAKPYPPPTASAHYDAAAKPYSPAVTAGYAYPPPIQGAAPYGAYPPQPGYGYPPPPPPGYGYPGPGGYGYPPVQKPPKKSGGMGMGLGAGLLGGMLGGLLIGDIVSDVGDCDVGGFDF